MVLRWDNLTLTYQSHGRETIHDVSGHVRRGECHLLAGDRAPLIKCLLQTLSGWLGPLQEGCGSLTWSGHECKPREWFSRVGFVPCDEVWERRFTVREHLLRSVRLRRWSVTSEEERYRLVREALEFFKLEAIADKSVGRSHHSSRLSKIERKIFPVALEYMGRPEVIFIETESGSESSDEAGDSWNLLTDDEIAHYCDLLKRLAKEKGVAIVMGTRNPKLLKAFRCDSASLFLNGQLIYSGSAEEMHRLLPLSLQSLSRDVPFSPPELEERNRLIDSMPRQVSGSPPVMEDSCDSPVSSRPCPWWANLYILVQGQIREDVRSRRHVASLVASFTIIYLLLAFVYFQLPLDVDGLVDRSGLFLYISFNLLLMGSIPKLVRFQLQLRKVAHDRHLHLIHAPCFVLSQWIAALPIRVLMVTILGTAVYYITGLRTDGFQHYIVFMADLYLMVGTSLALGIFVAAAIPRIEYSQLVMPFLVILFFQYGNLPVDPGPTWILRWIQYISPIFYSFQCLIQNELRGVDSPEGVDVDKFLGSYETMPIAACLPALAGFIIVYLILCCIITRLRSA